MTKISFKIDEGTLEAFDKIGVEKGFEKSRSAHIRVAIRRYILTESVLRGRDSKVIYQKDDKIYRKVSE